MKTILKSIKELTIAITAKNCSYTIRVDKIFNTFCKITHAFTWMNEAFIDLSHVIYVW